MNFYTKNNKINYVDVVVHSLKLIIIINNKNILYEHDKLWEAIKYLKNYFDEFDIKLIEDYLFTNYKHKNINIPFKPKRIKEGNQYKLF